MAIYADIILDIVHQSLDKVFQYRIPEHLISEIKIGRPVKVPFGKGDKLTLGYIMNISDEPQIHPSKIKEIQEVLSDKLTIGSGLIPLAFWMSHRYGATTITALKTVLPMQQKIRHIEKKYVHRLLPVEAMEHKLSYYQQKKYVALERIINALITKPVLTMSEVRKSLGISTATLKKLEDEQVIKITTEEVYRQPIAFNNTNRIEFQLTQEQDHVIQEVLSDYHQQLYKTYLLHGVTGSGKTEVYIRLIDEVIKSGRQAIVLIPEIALTYQTVKRFYEKFGRKVGVLHSKLSQGEKYDQYVQAKEGKLDIMIGPRSALFTPFKDLGMIIIDEEHETTYKSETTPKYHAREVAIKRASLSQASVLLSSATPALETYYKAKHHQYKLLKLTKRVDQRPLPKVEVVDMREELTEGNKTMLSHSLRQKIEECLNQKEQIILFINRRGYARFVSCRNCGYVMKCPHCDIAYTYHQSGQLVCHYCGKTHGLPTQCPNCQSQYIKQFGTGTQKVETYIKKEFPTAKVLRMDMDTTSKKNSYEKILTQFNDRKADILIGTQMVAKGHDFPHVTLVGVLAADLSLYMNDFRASERTFSLLTQVAGRAGRGDKKGQVVIQTYSPEHYSIQYAKDQAYERFYEEEITYRQLMHYPPFTHLMVLMTTSDNEKELIKQTEALGIEIKSQLDSCIYDIIGPSPASISKINDIYRQVLYIKAKEYKALLSAKKVIEEIHRTKYHHLNKQFDFNPMYSY